MSESDNVFFFKHKRFWLHCGLNLLIFCTVNLFLDGLFVFCDGKDVLSSCLLYTSDAADDLRAV